MCYLYENHLGGLYTSSEEISYDALYCEECGDSDWLLGTFNNKDELIDYLRSKIDFCGSGGYDITYLSEIVEKCWLEDGDVDEAV